MDKTELLKKYAREEEDRVPLASALDKMAACEKSGSVTATVFLTERQQVLAEAMLREVKCDFVTFYGGYADAERRVALFLPEWATEDSAPLTFIRAAWSEKSGAKPGHRDFLGSLMAAGIKRETVGDILPGENSCDIVTLSSVAPYLMQNLTSAGRAALSLSEIRADELLIPPREIKEVRDTVASLRLDSVVGAGFNLSRDKSAALIRSGRVILSGLQCEKPDKMLSGGETVSVRGLGKFRLREENYTTKKGRIGIVIEKFI
jgi:RNA-binding protein YlmH